MGRKSILIVDDSLFMRMVIRDILENAGYVIAGEATNGEEAIQMYEKLRPDMFTLDLTMPVKTGVEALKGIKEFDSSAKCVVCTAMGQKKMLLDAIKEGANDCVVKPLVPSELLGAVRRCVGNSGQVYNFAV